MSELQLRPYQAAAIEQLRAGIRAGHKRQILYAPTGAGKTEMAMALILEADQKFSRTAFLIDRIALCDQSADRFAAAKIAFGVIQAGHWRWRPHERHQICSVQTLVRRGMPEGTSMMIVDEAHTMYRTTTDFMLAHPDIITIGLTATPFTKGMGQLYSNVVNVATTDELIADGFLVPVKAYAAKAADMRGAAVKFNGEWSDSDIEFRAMTVVGDIITEWMSKTAKHFGGGVKTLVFSASVAHGEELCRRFQDAGYNFQQVSYKDGNDEKRKALIDEFRKADSEIMGLVSCEALAKGFDVPDVLCGIAARPYRKSLSGHIQQIGRVMRPHPGKEFSLWLCIAEGSRVLTHRGLVPIEQLQDDDLLWDGIEFVSHGGVIYKGEQETITYAGLSATDNHLVHTEKGWRPFGECAREQVAITQTGLGRHGIRVGEDHFSERSLAWGQATPIRACGVRVRDLWLSIRNFFIESARRANERLSSLQSTVAELSELALLPSAGNAFSLSLFNKFTISELWRARHRVSLSEREGGNALDYRQYRTAVARSVFAVRSNRQRWALRAGEPAVGGNASESVEQARRPVEREATPIPHFASENQLRRSDYLRTSFTRTDIRADSGEAFQAIVKTKRRVWDIINAGPRNRFTCENLLVHNCHSGNFLRFREDMQMVFSQGIPNLDERGLDNKVRPEPDEDDKKANACGGCGFFMTGPTCPACGWERPARQNLVQEISGELHEVGLKKSRASVMDLVLQDKDAVWRQICHHALDRKNGDITAAERFAKAQYRSLYGTWPRLAMRNITPEAPHYLLVNKIKQNLIAWSRRVKA